MEYQLIEKMNVSELKSYLRLRGLKVSGRKHELVARVFIAIENNVKVVKPSKFKKTLSKIMLQSLY